jgi:hypothetical protein
MSKNNLSSAVVPGPLEPRAEVNQEIIIDADGTLEIAWFVPKASDLVQALWNEINEKPFPIKVNSGQLYCG